MLEWSLDNKNGPHGEPPSKHRKGLDHGGVDSMTVNTTIPGDTREVRALTLYRERGAEIVRTGPWTYLVPSCTGTGSWAVNYRRETCDCPDFTNPRPGREPGTPCKHIYAVGIHRAKRRGERAS
jgi:hypothetical protein